MENAIGDEVFILPRRRYKNRSRDVELKPGLDDLVNQDMELIKFPMIA